MSNSKKCILTIAIPTYNRDWVIDSNLSNLCSFAGKYDCEILISDNCSTDNTQYIVKEFQNRFPFVKYVRNSKNLGYDMNVLVAYMACESEYSLLMGDSRTINEESLKYLMNHLEDNIDALVFKHTHEETIYHSINDVFLSFGESIIVLGSFVLKCIMIEDKLLDPYIGKFFLHIGLFYEALNMLENINVKLVNNVNSHFVVRHKPIGWGKVIFQTHAYGWFYTFMGLPNSIPVELKLSVIKIKYDDPFSVKTISKRIGHYGPQSKSDFNKYKKLLPLISNTPLWKIKTMVFLPTIFCDFLHLIYKTYAYLKYKKENKKNLFVYEKENRWI